MKILALNLPAYHEVEINNKVWGKGFTEWDNVKKGTKYFENHYQPVVPLNQWYYDLSKPEDIEKQIELANRFGVDGFVYYHYWFGNGVQALEKPMEILRNAIKKQIEYCFCWANQSWFTTWHGKSSEIIVKQEYGKEEEWVRHIKYLLSFFTDPRYIKVGNRPVLYVYNMSDIPDRRMFDVWNNILREEGFGDIYLIEFISSKNKDISYDKTDAVVEFEPLYTTYFDLNKVQLAKRVVCKLFKTIDFQDYDVLWKKIIKRNRVYNGKAIYKGCFVGWDNSPRKAKNSMIVRNATPEKFEKNLEALIHNNRKDASNEFVLINAWNEWSEGAYLEPDELNGFAYLQAIKNIKESHESER